MMILDTYRYAQGADSTATIVDGYPNYHHVTAAPGRDWPKLMLERGINPARMLRAPDEERRPVIAIRSSPWKAGHASNPWHDEFDLDHGHVRYYGDHKPGTNGLPGATAGNRALLEAWRQHAGTSSYERSLAPPLLLFRSATVRRGGQRIVKGHVEFCGVAVIERLEHIVQRDPASGRSFPNLALDLAVLDLAETGDTLDMRWIDDRRDDRLTTEQSQRYAPASWTRWVSQGRAAIPRVRRRVVSSRVKSTTDQLPEPDSTEDRCAAAVVRLLRQPQARLRTARVAGDRPTPR